MGLLKIYSLKCSRGHCMKVTFCVINRKIALSSMVEVVDFEAKGNVLFLASMHMSTMQ